MVQRFEAPSFFTYTEGTWVRPAGGGDYVYTVPPPCNIEPLDCALASRVLRKVRASRSPAKPFEAPVVIHLIGDSVQHRPAQLLLAQIGKAAAGCDLPPYDVMLTRTDYLSMDEPWLNKTCGADVTVLNTGAHWHDPRAFDATMSLALEMFNLRCRPAGTARLVFRTTPEGNPLCNTVLEPFDAQGWEANVWPVLNGSRKTPETDKYYSRAHTWDFFQRYNAMAAKQGAKYPWFTLLDVVPLTRLRPTEGWETRPGKPLDCLHGNPAVATWNVLLFNVLDALL